jgi:hypothetical protein
MSKNTVHHHPDGYILVRAGELSYADTLANLNDDFNVDFPALPAGAIERIYDQGKRHTFMGEEGVTGGGQMPWPFGDNLILNIQAGIDAKEIRLPPPPPSQLPDTSNVSIEVTQDNAAAQQIFIGTVPPNVLRMAAFIGRWTDPEYALFLQKRAQATQAGAATDLLKQWDQHMATGQINLTSDFAISMKAKLVNQNILTQARADAIFR